jgi:hypothetical protein
MTIEEIKTIFGIDITEKNRSTPYLALRYFYAEMRVKQIKGNISKKYITTANEINCNRDNLYNMLLKAEVFKKDELIKYIYKAFKTKEKRYFEEYLNKKQEQINNYQKIYEEEKTLRNHVPAERKDVVVKVFRNDPLLKNLQVADFLKANKILSHPLWDVPAKNISPNQWQKLKKINPEMFEQLVNSKL